MPPAFQFKYVVCEVLKLKILKAKVLTKHSLNVWLEDPEFEHYSGERMAGLKFTSRWKWVPDDDVSRFIGE